MAQSKQDVWCRLPWTGFIWLSLTLSDCWAYSSGVCDEAWVLLTFEASHLEATFNFYSALSKSQPRTLFLNFREVTYKIKYWWPTPPQRFAAFSFPGLLKDSQSLFIKMSLKEIVTLHRQDFSSGRKTVWKKIVTWGIVEWQVCCCSRCTILGRQGEQGMLHRTGVGKILWPGHRR